MADPLSTATRATKRNLLIASVIAISASAFNISIDRIPVGGLFALLTIFLHLDLSPIANHLPSFKELGAKHP